MLAAVRRALLRVRQAITPGRADDDARREVAAHLALLEDDLRAQGLDADEARQVARHRFGSVERARDHHRDARSIPWLDDARLDLGVAVRHLARRPSTTLLVVVIAALAVATTTTLFSLVYGVLYRPLPWADADRLIRLEESRGGKRGRVPWTISNATYLAWESSPSDTVEAIGGWRSAGANQTLTGAGDAAQVAVAWITPSLPDLLRISPALGRPFVPADAGPGATSVVLLSHGLWQRAFGGRADVLGRTLHLDGHPHSVVGVMPRTFAFPDPSTQAWLPMHVMPVLGDGGVRRVMIFGSLARLAPGITLEQAQSEATARAATAPELAQAALALFGHNGPITITATTAHDVATREVRPALNVLLAAVALLFAAAVASLLSLQLARVAERRREFAVRAALGAGVSRLARQWVIESLLVGGAGTLVGLALSLALHATLATLLPLDFPRVQDVHLDAPVAAMAIAATLLASVCCGLVPAWIGRRDSLVDVLAQDSLAPVGGSIRTATARGRLLVMAAQVAIACVLVIGTTVLTRSVHALTTADRGFSPQRLLTARIALPPKATYAQAAPLVEAMRERLGASGLVSHVGVGNGLPFVSSGGFRGLTMPSPLDPSATIDVQTIMRVVNPDYFGALRLRLLRGRLLDAGDTAAALPVVVVNRTFAAQYLGGVDVGGRLTFTLGSRKAWDVVGVVDDMRQGGLSGVSASRFGGLSDPPQPEMFLSLSQWDDPLPEAIVVLRTPGDPTAVVPTLRAIVRDVSPALAIDSVVTMEERVLTSLALPRTFAWTVGLLGLFALTIAGTGLYGLLSHAAAQRTREIGVRSALGATPADVLRLVLSQAWWAVLAGVATGIGIALAGAEALRALLYGVSPRDVPSFLVGPALLVLVALLACVVPAWRAWRVDPLTALRGH